MALCLSAVKSWQQRTHLAKLTVSLSYKKKKSNENDAREHPFI